MIRFPHSRFPAGDMANYTNKHSLLTAQGINLAETTLLVDMLT